ncbi:MAG: hypothetical protein Q8P41_04845 [Pseudomonadota bacterium]|nr:hypothetical protein [Pseudomonadota bacterium]
MRATVLALLLVSFPARATPDNSGVPDRLAALEARVAELEADRDTCVAELDVLTEDAAAQAEALEEVTEDVGVLEGVVSTALDDLDRYGDLLEEALARVPVHEPDWTSFDDRVVVLEGEVSELHDALADLLDCVAAWLHGDTAACASGDDEDPNGQGE